MRLDRGRARSILERFYDDDPNFSIDDAIDELDEALVGDHRIRAEAGI